MFAIAITIATVEFKIEKLIYGGDGIARLPPDERGPGKTVFVPFVLENEVVDAELTEQRPGFARSSLKTVIQPSPDRVQPPCPYFQRCGGCHYQHADYRHQLAIKETILRETLRRTAKMELPCELQIHCAEPWNYRNRTRMKVEPQPAFALGYYKFRSHELLPIEQCPISSPLINRAIFALWEKGRAGEIDPCIREIELFANHIDSALLLEFYCAPGTPTSQAQAIAESLRSLLPEIRGASVFEISVRPGREPDRLASAGAFALSYQARSATYRVSAGSFFQANRYLLDELVEIATRGASGALALDLYAGVGLFSLALARSFAQVIAVESSQTSYHDLRQNAPREVKAVRATTEQYLGKVFGVRPDLVVADPPRGGLGENVVRDLAKLSSPRITYVSCDPSTLARDLRMLLTLGYQIKEAHLVDLFPQTFHLESVFQLARR
jgi:23S rRNA (uracil1939-C5)-methyltransferase